MPKKSYALRNRRGYMDSTFDEGLRIVLQWMERRRQDIELLLQKELYMLRRMWYPRHYGRRKNEGGLLPGGPEGDFFMREEVDYFRNRMGTRSRHGLPYYAPGY